MDKTCGRWSGAAAVGQHQNLIVATLSLRFRPASSAGGDGTTSKGHLSD
jgi:hypothetical protein